MGYNLFIEGTKPDIDAAKNSLQKELQVCFLVYSYQYNKVCYPGVDESLYYRFETAIKIRIATVNSHSVEN